jgi:ABC-2 type transport system permease protein
LLRDVRGMLLAIALLLLVFQCLWAKITDRILGQLAPFFTMLASAGGLKLQDVEDTLFEGQGQIMRTLIGGEQVTLDNAMAMLSIGYVHPLMQTVFCIWAIGRAAGAIAGELDRGTMELLLAQPLPRYRVVLSHLCVDAIALPLLCLSLWAGNYLGAWAISPIQIRTPEAIKKPLARTGYLVKLGPFTVLRVNDPLARVPQAPKENQADLEDRLKVTPSAFGPALLVVGGLMFAISGLTMWLSALGRFRWRVLGLAVFLGLLQFLINLVGQMWDVMAPLRPLSLFYYFQPQQVILGDNWCVNLSEWNGGKELIRVPMLAVLIGVGLFGYVLALWRFQRRDLPAPL